MAKRWLLASVSVVLAVVGTSISGGVASGAPDTVVTKKTPDGVTITIRLLNARVNAVPPLDSSPFSREAFLNGDNTVSVKGPDGATIRGATMETGYHIGFPAKVGADGGATVTLTSPDLTINGGLNASVTPSVQGQGSFGSNGGSGTVGGGVSGTLGGNAGAQSNIIPKQTASFKVEHGGITEVPVGRIAMSADFAYLSLAGVHLAASGAVGQMTIRTFTRVVIRTEFGSTQAVAYGPAIRL